MFRSATAGKGRPTTDFAAPLAMWVLGFVNAVVHAKDAWAIMPEGLDLPTAALLALARPFSVREGNWGAWEVAARRRVADLNARVVRGVPQVSAGGVFGGWQEVMGTPLSWYPNKCLRFVLNWNIVNVDRLNAAGATRVGQRFRTVGLRPQLAF